MLMMNTFLTGPLEVNCYVVYDTETKKAFMVDPGGYSSALTSFVESQKLKMEFVILTHAHGDHIGGVEEYCKKFNAPLYAHEDEAVLLRDARYNFSAGTLGRKVVLEADRYLKDGEEIDFSDRKIKIIHTPGHSPGGICILIEKWLFCGDTLFAGSVGRYDFPLCNGRAMFESIKNKLFTLDPEIEAFPGHGPSTTIGNEKMYNPFF